MQAHIVVFMKQKLQIPGFELIEKIGQGGMAVVWKARQMSLDRVVAVKLLNPQVSSDAGYPQRLLAEAHAAANLKHSGIVQVYDAGIVDGVPYFVMEYIAGYSVGQWLHRKKKLSEDDALVVVECVARALDYAWKNSSIIHCDIKPDNIMVDMDGAIKVADLGLARSIGGGPGAEENKTDIMGTPGYISPEQSGGLVDLDCRADIYSLGATLYHLTTGKRLFDQYDDAEAMDMHVTGNEQDPLVLCPDLSPGICWLMDKMLVKNRRHRYPDWDPVIEDVDLVKRGYLPKRPFPPAGASTVTRSDKRLRETREWERQQQYRRQRRRLMRCLPVLAGLLALGLTAFVLWLERRRREPPPPPPPIEEPVVYPVFPEKIPAEEPEAEEEGNGERDAARDLYLFVLQWMEDNPERYDEAIRRLNHVVEGARGTKYSLKAEDKIEHVRAKREAAIENVWDAVAAELEAMADEKRFREAADYALGYGGPWHGELRERLQGRAAELIENAEDHEMELERIQQHFAAAIDELTQVILGDDIAGALAFLEKRADDPGLATKRAEFDELKGVLRASLKLDAEVLNSFAEQAGEEIEIELVQGTDKFHVLGVRGGKLLVERRLDRDARVEFEFGIDELATREYVARLGDPGRHEVALGSGWRHYREGNFAVAEELFVATHPLLSASLGRNVRAARRELREEQAHESFNLLLQDMNIDERPPDYENIFRSLQAMQISPEMSLSLSNRVERFREKHRDTELLERIDPVLTRLLDFPEEESAEEPTADHAPEASVEFIDEVELAVALEEIRKRNPNIRDHEIMILRNGGNRPYGLRFRSRALQDIAPLASLKRLRELECSDGAFRDLTPLAQIPGLAVLRLDNCSVRDFEPLKYLSLEKLGLPRSQFAEVNLLRHMPLRELDLNHTAVRDISGLSGIPLQSLEIEDTRVSSLHGLRGMPLERLNLAGTQIRDITFLQDMPLRELNLARTGVFEFSRLRSLELQSLNVSGTQFRELPLLSGMPLRHLDLSDTRVSDISPLRGMPLRRLDLSNTRVSDISPLRGMPLQHLSLRNTFVRDLAPLQGADIHSLFIDQCRNIRDLAFTDGMPLRELGISGSGIRDLSDLRARDLNALFMENTEISDISHLRGMPVHRLHLRGSPIEDYGPLADLPVRDLTLDLRRETAREVLWRMRSLRYVNGEPWMRLRSN